MFKKSPDPGEEILNNLMRRAVRGETITMMEYLEAMEDLSEEPEETPSRREIQDAVEARHWFRAELDRFGLPIDNRYQLCVKMYERAEKEPSPELLRLLCYILCDVGTLLDLDRDPDFHSPEQDARCWRKTRKDAEELYANLMGRKQMSVRFRDLLERTKKSAVSRPSAGNVRQDDAMQVEQVFDAYVRVFSPKGEQSSLKYNISALLQMAGNSSDLTAVKPLFLYRALTRHRKRLENKSDLRIDFNALWKRKVYKIDDDNGKNYQTYAKYLSLFEELYRIFAAEDGVDAPLCLYGFSRLSNLGDFYRCYPPDRQSLPLEPSIEDLLIEIECMFTLYEHGHGDNILLTDSGLSCVKLDRFQCSKDRNVLDTFARIETYMNRDIRRFLARFLDADPDQVRELCVEVLENADLSEKQRPKTKQDRQLYLAAINGGLMEIADDFAEGLLADACKMLIGEDVS